MRNGMSVKEIYDRLDQYDRLESFAATERRKYEALMTNIQRAIRSIDNTARTYRLCSLDAKIDESDRLGFIGRVCGLAEASRILRDILDGGISDGE